MNLNQLRFSSGSRRRLAGACANSLAAITASWGFQARVLALPQGASSGDLAPVADAKITCDGCTLPLLSVSPGEFVVDLGATYKEPGPVVLHVSAPRYRTLDVTVNHSFTLASDKGPSSLTFVLEPLDSPVTVSPAPAAPPSAGAAGSSP